MKKIFNYDETTGLYIGEGIAHTDPETGGALLPRNATTERPPAFNAVYRGGTWHVPETATPETATPETATPEAATPETATPETATPETATPEKQTSMARSRPPMRRR